MVEMFTYDPFEKKRKDKEAESNKEEKEDTHLKCDNCSGTGFLTWPNSNLDGGVYEADCPCCYGVGVVIKGWA